MLNRGRIRLLVLLSSLLVTVTCASPTKTDGDEGFGVRGVSLAPDMCEHSVYDTTQIAEPASLNLTHIADGILEPPIVSSATSPSVGVKPLPAVPRAVLMVVAGFLCVSLVKDRRVWLSALAALLWLGQIGLTTLPQLAWHVLGKKQVLRHTCHNVNSGFGLKVASAVWAKSAQTRTYSPSPAIISVQYVLGPLLKGLVPKTEQPICFSPALTFDVLARGPPVGA